MKFQTIVLKESVLAKPPMASAARYTLVAATGKKKPGSVNALTVEIKETSAMERYKLRNEKGTLIAPAMPMFLVKRFKGKGRSVKPPKESWGIAAVGASDTKPSLSGKGVTVAVLDTGIDPSHPAFAGIKLVRRNFTPDADDDVDGHGTHCAGTIFGRDVDGCRIGVAPGVSRVLIGKVIGKDGASTEKVIEAIHWALTEGATVISMSLGIDFAGYQKELVKKDKLAPEHATSIALAGYRDTVRIFDKISSSLSSGPVLMGSAIVTAAAGNESDRPQYSITVAPPAAAEFFLSVAAVGPGSGGAPFEIASFSNDGAMFAAPGVDIWSARLGGGVVPESGTSMATPHVAGVAARWIGKLLADGKPFTAATVIDLMKTNRLTISPSVPEEDALFGLVQGPK